MCLNNNVFFAYSIHAAAVLLSHFSHVQLCVTPQTAAHQAPPSLGFSRQEYWSGLSFPFPVHVSEKWKWSHSVKFDFSQPHGLQPARLLHPWEFPGKSTGVGCHCLLCFPYKQYMVIVWVLPNYFGHLWSTIVCCRLKIILGSRSCVKCFHHSNLKF